MDLEQDDSAFAGWLKSLESLTDSSEAARVWRERRYRFAHRLGSALVDEGDRGPRISGAAIYGVWLNWGLLYVGQTTEAERRLRDLAIGESHHLANTFPPETWKRVVVIAWPKLPESVDLVDRIGVKVVGLALEHHMQAWSKPMANGARRTAAGGWQPVDHARSASMGARTAKEVTELFEVVRTLWDEAAGWSAGSSPLPHAARCVYAADLLADDPTPQDS